MPIFPPCEGAIFGPGYREFYCSKHISGYIDKILHQNFMLNHLVYELIDSSI